MVDLPSVLKRSVRRVYNVIYDEIFFWKRAKKHGVRREIVDWIEAFVVAAVIYFIVMPVLLATSSPAVVVSSCSEKGYMNVGDVVIVQGVSVADINAPEVVVDAYRGFVPIFEEGEVKAINISGRVVRLNRSADVVVYYAYPSGYQIIHRVFAKVRTPDGYLLITKGDANPWPDQMGRVGDQFVVCVDENVGCVSTPVNQRMLAGKVIWGLPFIGHVKLFFCDLTFGLLCEGHANAGTNYQYVLSC